MMDLLKRLVVWIVESKVISTFNMFSQLLKPTSYIKLSGRIDDDVGLFSFVDIEDGFGERESRRMMELLLSPAYIAWQLQFHRYWLQARAEWMFRVVGGLQLWIFPCISGSICLDQTY
jgi:hypothetical protein